MVSNMEDEEESLDIYLNDLKEEAQKRVLDFYGFVEGGHNLDVVPLMVLHTWDE